jgi:Chitin binding Peritrophin-A domain
VILCVVLLGTASAAYHPGMRIATTPTDSADEYAEYEQSLYCDALRCIGSNGRPLKSGSIVRADVCGSFCLCTDEKVVRFDCPANLHFNEATGQCDFPQLAQCLPEFLTKEALELYMKYNPDKMRSQGYSVEQWRRMWKCVDCYKKNETMPNEIRPALDAKTSIGKETEPTPKPEQQISDTKNTSIAGNLQKSSSPQTKSINKVTENIPTAGSTTSTSRVDTITSPKLSNAEKGAPQKKPINEEHGLDSSSAEVKQSKIPLHDSFEKEEQLNVKRESSSSGMEDAITKKTSTMQKNTTISTSLSSRTDDSMSDSSGSGASFSINGTAKHTKINALSEKDSEGTAELSTTSGASRQIKGGENTSNSSFASNSRDTQISGPKNSLMPKDADVKARSKVAPAVAFKQGKNAYDTRSAVSKNRFAITQDKFNGTSPLRQDNFFATVVEMAHKISKSSRENNHSLNKTQNSTNADTRRINATNANASQIREKVAPKPELKDYILAKVRDSFSKQKIVNKQQDLRELNQKKVVDASNEKSIKTSGNSRNVTAPARLSEINSRKTPAASNKLRAGTSDQVPSKNTTDVKEKVSTEPQNPGLSKLKSDAPRNKSNATSMPTKDELKSKTENADQKLDISQNTVETKQGNSENRTDTKKNLLKAAPSKNIDVDLSQTTPSGSTKANTKRPNVDLKSGKEIVESNQSVTLETTETKKNISVESRTLTTKTKLGTRQKTVDESIITPSQKKEQVKISTPVEDKKTNSMAIVNKTKDVTVDDHTESINLSSNEDVSSQEINSKVAPNLNLKHENDKSPEAEIKSAIRQNSSSVESSQEPADEDIKGKPITGDQEKSIQVTQRPNMTNKSHETFSSKEVERQAVADLKLKEDNEAEIKSKEKIAEKPSKRIFPVPINDTPTKPLQENKVSALKGKLNNATLSDPKEENTKKPAATTPPPVKDASDKLNPIKSGIREKQPLRSGQKSSNSPIEGEKASHTYLNEQQNSAAVKTATELKLNASSKPANQDLKTNESNATAEVKASNADKPVPSEEFKNTEDENSSTGELLMKLRKALQDVYETAARSNKHRTNHEHLTFKKRIRLLRNKRKSREAARRGKLHRLRH